MASVRRTKNFAQDGQTPMFLYAILKQLDLRSIDWNQVAASLDISNGHAARMRYSRMRTQFEGMSNQAKPQRAKKEKETEGKSAKEKAAKGKRALLEEENERLAKGKNRMQTSEMQQDLMHKRVKLGQYDTPSWTSPVMPGQQYDDSFWTQTTIKTEPSTAASSILVNSPLIKNEIEFTTSDASNSLPSEQPIKQEASIKEELTTSAVEEELRRMIAADSIKRAPSRPPNRLAMKQEAAYAETRYNSSYPSYVPRYATPAAPGYYQPFPMPTATSSTYPMHQTYSYGPWLNQRPSPNPWAQSAMSPVASTISNDSMIDNISLHPHASSYEDLLNMPLYVGNPQNFQFDIDTSEPSDGQVVTENTVIAPAQNAAAIAQQPTPAEIELHEKTTSSPVLHSVETSTPDKNNTEMETAKSGNSSEQPTNAAAPVAAPVADNSTKAEGSVGPATAEHSSNVDADADADADAEHELDTTTVTTVEVEPKVVIKAEPIEILDP
nr:hypothetical protein LTR18_005830 [Exophiala xenobiotica]